MRIRIWACNIVYPGRSPPDGKACWAGASPRWKRGDSPLRTHTMGILIWMEQRHMLVLGIRDGPDGGRTKGIARDITERKTGGREDPVLRCRKRM